MYEIVSVFDGGREVSRVYIYIYKPISSSSSRKLFCGGMCWGYSMISCIYHGENIWFCDYIVVVIIIIIFCKIIMRSNFTL